MHFAFLGAPAASQERTTLLKFAKSQVDYALGGAYRSFVVGWGTNPPLRVSTSRPPSQAIDVASYTAACAAARIDPGGPRTLPLSAWRLPMSRAAAALVRAAQVHHAGASCPNLPAPCDWSAFDAPGPNPQVRWSGPPGLVLKGPQHVLSLLGSALACLLPAQRAPRMQRCRSCFAVWLAGNTLLEEIYLGEPKANCPALLPPVRC